MTASASPARSRTNGAVPSRLSELTPGRGDRASFIGQTGSGKTTLARELLDTRVYVAVLDAKGTLEWPGYHFVRRLDQAMASQAPRILYRPDHAELADAEVMDQFFRWCYLRRHTTVYVDELAAVTQGDTYPYHFGACLTRGRELGVEMWMSTQRPTRIPQVALSESEHVYCFRLRLPQDRQRVEQTASIPAELIAELPKRQFLYSRQDGDAVSGRMILSLPSRP